MTWTQAAQLLQIGMIAGTAAIGLATSNGAAADLQTGLQNATAQRTDTNISTARIEHRLDAIEAEHRSMRACP